jgi:hypothetical protein
MYDKILEEEVTNFPGQGDLDLGQVNNMIYNEDFSKAIMGNC